MPVSRCLHCSVSSDRAKYRAWTVTAAALCPTRSRAWEPEQHVPGSLHVQNCTWSVVAGAGGRERKGGEGERGERKGIGEGQGKAGWGGAAFSARGCSSKQHLSLRQPI